MELAKIMTLEVALNSLITILFGVLYVTGTTFSSNIAVAVLMILLGLVGVVLVFVFRFGSMRAILKQYSEKKV